MNVARERSQGSRGAERLLAHCAAIEELARSHQPALYRLERVLGPDLTRLLLAALTGDHRMRPRGLPDWRRG